VVYSLKDIHFFSGNHGVPEALSLAVTVAIHVWKRNMLLSMAAGTACCMALARAL